MSAPFRDLFVELPRALFDVLHGIGEAAVSIAQPLPRREPKVLTFLRRPLARRLIAEKLGWNDIKDPILAAMDDAVDLRVTRACGHQSIAGISSYFFAQLEDLKPQAAFDELLRLLSRHYERGRQCTCIWPQCSRCQRDVSAPLAHFDDDLGCWTYRP